MMMPVLNLFQTSSMAAWLEGLELQLMDVGARGGIDLDFLPAAWATRTCGFEPEPHECVRLNAGSADPWRFARFVPVAVAGVNGPRSLYVPQNGEGASLLQRNSAMVGAFGYHALHGATTEVRVDALTLDSSCEQFDLAAPDYLKLDVEGAELEILCGASATLHRCAAVKLEASFLEQRLAQALMPDVVAFMRGAGFALVDIRGVHFWRRRPLPAHPYSSRMLVPYSRGIAAQCDLVFLRNPETVAERDALGRLVAVSAVLGFFDYAVAILREAPSVERDLSQRIGNDFVTELGKVSRRMGRAVAFRELRMQFRSMIPLVRSLCGGIPHHPSVMSGY